MNHSNRQRAHADASRRDSAPASPAADEEETEMEYDDVWPPRRPSSSRRYDTASGRTHTTGGYPQSAIPLRTSARTATQQHRSRRLEGNPLETRVLPGSRPVIGRVLIVTGGAMLIMVLGWMALSTVSAWWQVHQDDVTYGRPRTYQVDAVVGHHDSANTPSHFIALNLNRHVVVIELPGGDASKALIYLGPTLVGDGQDLTPVTLTFVESNGTGKPDMQVHILDQIVVFHNDGTKFVSP